MSYSLGTASGEIITSYNGKGVDSAKRDIDSLTGKTGAGKGAINDISNAAGAAGLAIAGGFALAVNSAANFEQRMSAVKAVSGASATEMDQLTKKALQLGKDTSFSAGEAAQAIEELVKAGVSVPDVMNGAADATVALAAAGEIALPQAATIAANAMNQFNLAAKDMPHVADLIAGAANASAIDVSEFGQSMTQVGAVANLMGVSFDDTATAIALMGNAGIKGSDAGTSLKTMLMNLQPQTKKQTELFKQLGLITKDGTNIFLDADGKMSSLADVSGILQRSLQGMGKAQKAATLQTLFGTDAVRAAAILANEGAVGFDKMSISMGKMKAADVAKTRMDNFKGSLEQAKGSLETAGIVIGTVLLPVLRDIIDRVTAVVNAFLSLDQNTQGTILAIIGVVGAALLVTAAILKIILVVQKVVTILKVLRTAMAITWVAALGPIALIIVAIAAIVAIFIILWKRSAAFRGFFIGIWNGIKAVVSSVLKWFTGTLWPGIQSVWDAIVSGLQAVGRFFVTVWNGIKTGVGAVIKAITLVITTYIKIWVTIFTTVFNAITAAITFAANVWKTIITTVTNFLLGIWRVFWGIFGGIITAAFNLIVQIIKLGVAIWLLMIREVMATITTVVTAAWNYLTTFIRGTINLISSIITTVWNAIRTASVAVWNAIKTVIGVIWGGIKQAAITNFNLIKTVITTVWNAIRTVSSTVWNAIKTVITAAINAVKAPVQAAVNAVKSAITTAWNAVKTATSTAWGALAGIVAPKIQAVHDKVSAVVDKIKSIFSGASKWLYNAGRDIIQGLLNGIESLINNVTSKLKSLTDLIPKLKGPPEKDKKLLYKNGRLIMQGLGDGIERELAPFLKMIESITPMIPASVEQRTVQQLIPSGLVPAGSRVASTPTTPQATGAGTSIHLTTINPVGKTSVEELSDQVTRLAMLGVV